MRRFILISILFLAGNPLTAQDRKQADLAREEAEDYYRKWLQKDAVYIITGAEKEIFRKLRTDDERDAFIEQFWRRRDPDPQTPENEFRSEHYRRIAYANEYYHSGEPGWKTDRGEIYIKFGSPDGKETNPTMGPYNRRLSEGGGQTTAFAFERWRYNFIEGIGNNIEIEFVDPTNTGEYRIALSPQDKDALLYVATPAGNTDVEDLGLEDRWLRMTRDSGLGIQARSMHYDVHPDDFPFEKLRRLSQIQKAPISPEVRRLKEEVTSRVAFNQLPFEVSMHQIRVAEGSYLVPITLQVKNNNLLYQKTESGYNTNCNIYGMVSDLSGRVVVEFDHQLRNYAADEALQKKLSLLSLFQRTVQLSPGRYKLALFVHDLGSGQLGSHEASIVIPKQESTDLILSPVILAHLVEQARQDPEYFEQFTLGNLKVVPNVSRVFHQDQLLYIYLQAYNVQIDQDSLDPQLGIRYYLKQEGRIVEAFPDLKGQSINYVSPRRVVMVTAFKLEQLPPGSYEVQVLVKDTISGQEQGVRTNFRLQ